MDPEVMQKIANLEMFFDILKRKGEDQAVAFAEMVLGEEIPDDEAKEKPHLTAVK